MSDRTYVAIDLKSFYASAECVARGLDPLTTNLVVADLTRTEKTICLAVTPSLKAYGISGRARLFEVVEGVRRINIERRKAIRGAPFSAASSDAPSLAADPTLELTYIVAPPRMAYYMEISTRVYDTYLEFVSPEDVHIYSVDEVFIDVTGYLNTYGVTAHELTRRMVTRVLEKTGITATAGIGTNLYLAKVAMDIWAKHIPADADGVRIAELTERSYRERLWSHLPLTDFWRVGHGTAARLAGLGLYTMGDIARCSTGGPHDFHNEALLYKTFGVNAELLIDHAWGWEPCTIGDIRAYRPKSRSLSSGQVLSQPYSFDKARLVVHEMTDALVLDMVEKGLVADQMVLTVGYDSSCLTDKDIRSRYHGEVELDWYGKPVPGQAHGSINLRGFTSSSRQIIDAVLTLFDRIVHPALLVRRMYVVANHITEEGQARQAAAESFTQMSLFDMAPGPKVTAGSEDPRERRIQEAVLSVKHRYGKNALVKGMNLEEGATAMERNRQIGGHKA